MIEKYKPYFDRLNIVPQNLSFELVAELQRKHLAEFSFNNLAVLLGQAVSLDIGDIIEKIIVQNRGGYCFEHNKLMHCVLEELGFNVRCLLARVLNSKELETARTHRVTLLEWNSEFYIIDVGFGPNCPRGPIKVKLGEEFVHGTYAYCLAESAYDDFQLELLTESGAYTLYAFNLEHYTDADCEMSNFYSSHHPETIFVVNLAISRIFDDVTLSLRNDQYHKIGASQTEIIQVENQQQLQNILADDFGIELSDAECCQLYKVAI